MGDVEYTTTEDLAYGQLGNASSLHQLEDLLLYNSAHTGSLDKGW